MAMPIGGIRRPVTIVDCAGDEVSITDGKLDVNATVTVPGDTPEMAIGSQLLSAGALTLTDAIAKIKVANFVALHLSGDAGDQTMTVTFVSADGANFTTLILSETIPAGSLDKYFALPPQTLLRVGDHIKVTLTATGAPAVTVYATIGFGT